MAPIVLFHIVPDGLLRADPIDLGFPVEFQEIHCPIFHSLPPFLLLPRVDTEQVMFLILIDTVQLSRYPDDHKGK